MAKTVACVIVRSVSTRLPLKGLRSVTAEYTMLGYIIERLKLVKNIDDIYICTSEEDVDDIFEDISNTHDVNLYRGSADEVIERMISVAGITMADNVIRITGDNVFTSIEYLDFQIDKLIEDQLDYIRLIDVPIGATAEVIKVSALKHCYQNMDRSISEYLLLFIFNPDVYKCGVITLRGTEYANYSLTVDRKEDLIRTKEVLSLFKGNELRLTLRQIISAIKKNNIDNAIFTDSGEVKMPYNAIISFEEFKIDMDNRVRKSINYTIDEK